VHPTDSAADESKKYLRVTLAINHSRLDRRSDAGRCSI
jgi:hypothetical protein